MGQPHPPPPRQHGHHLRNGNVPPLRQDIDEADVHALVEENAELRKLVIALSKLVIRNAVDRR
jgi:hypothetical protein